MQRVRRGTNVSAGYFAILRTMRIEGASYSETLIPIYQITHCDISENRDINTVCRENLKSNKQIKFY
jgi:hypothetical protein